MSSKTSFLHFILPRFSLLLYSSLWTCPLFVPLPPPLSQSTFNQSLEFKDTFYVVWFRSAVAFYPCLYFLDYLQGPPWIMRDPKLRVPFNLYSPHWKYVLWFPLYYRWRGRWGSDGLSKLPSVMKLIKDYRLIQTQTPNSQGLFQLRQDPASSLSWQ